MLQGLSCSVSISNWGTGRASTFIFFFWSNMELLTLTAWIADCVSWKLNRRELRWWGGRKERRKRNNIQIEYRVWQLCNKWKRKRNRVVRKRLDDSSHRHMHLWETNYPFHYPFPSLVPWNPLIVWFQQVLQLYNFDMSTRKIASASDGGPNPHISLNSFRFSDFKII